MPRLKLSDTARADLLSILEHISADNPAAAGRVVEVITARLDHLQVHPEIGRMGRVKGTRELVIGTLPLNSVCAFQLG